MRNRDITLHYIGLLTGGNGLDDTNLYPMQRHTSADTGVEQNDKSSAQSGDEEEHLGALRLLLCHEGAESTDTVQHDQGGQAQRSIQLSSRERFECFNNGVVWSTLGIDILDAHQFGHLASSNIDGRAGHEGANSWERDELDNPAQARKTQEGDD